MTTEREQILARAIASGAVHNYQCNVSFPPDAVEGFYNAAHKQGAIDLVATFARHVGGDGEFWLHELADFLENHYGK